MAELAIGSRSLSTDAPKESSRYICDVRTKQLAAIPTLFDLPPAKIEHPRCMLLGADCCEYIIGWRERRTRSHAVVGAGLGAAAVALLGFTTPLSPPLLVALTTAFVVAGWALGRVTELRRDVADRVQDLIDHQTTLARSIGAGEDRFRQLLEAKAEVEKKVEEKTHELRETSDKLAATLDEVQALDRAKTDFFNNVSHELRSPLTLVLAPLEELASGRLPPGGQRAAYETMHRNASRLLRLINQLLDLAKIDAAEMKIAPVPTDLIAILSAR
jgi:signal transduction histidine kinase